MSKGSEQVKQLDTLTDIKSSLAAKMIAVIATIALVASCFSISSLAFATEGETEEIPVSVETGESSDTTTEIEEEVVIETPTSTPATEAGEPEAPEVIPNESNEGGNFDLDAQSGEESATEGDEADSSENENLVAKIGETSYETLQDAANAAKDGETITVMQSFTVADDYDCIKLVNCDKSITLDLNGYTLTNTYSKGDVIYLNGSTATNRYAALTVIDSSPAKSGRMVATNEGAHLQGNVTLTLDGVTLEGGNVGIQGNGQEKHWGTKVILNNSNVSGGIVGIYQPQKGTLTVNGGNITGLNSAVEIRAGEMIVNGNAVLTATANEYVCNPNGNGTTTTGAAVAIAQHTTKQDIALTINGGTFNGVKALSECNPQENDPEPKVALSVKNGIFNGGISVADVNNFISGGTFSAKPDDAYLAKSYVFTLQDDGTYLVQNEKDAAIEKAVASVTINGETSYYESLEEAIREAIRSADGGTVEVRKDITVDVWNQIWNAHNVTIKGGNHTLTVNKIESNGNGDYLLNQADQLNVQDLNIVLNGGNGAFNLKSGTLTNITVTGGTYAVLPGADGVTIENSTFNGQKEMAIYTPDNTGARDLVVNDCTFNDTRIAIFRDNETLTNCTATGATNWYQLTIVGTGTVVSNNVFSAPLEFYAQPSEIQKNDFSDMSGFDEGKMSVGSLNSGETVDLSKNYWGDNLPEGIEGLTIQNYYADKSMTNLVCFTHQEVPGEAVAPTCTETGLTAGTHCAVCQQPIEAQETVPALGHAWVNGQ